MASHLEIGKAGEKLAEAYLTEVGFKILHRNWRCGHEEIDIIASRENQLHFVEVKYRSSDHHSHPEEAVNKKKLRSLLKGVDQFLHQHPQYIDFRLDILAITEKREGIEYFFIEDVTL
jgi:putative endonuclease